MATRVHGITGVESVSVGGYFACSVASAVVCWGDGGLGSTGDARAGGGWELPQPVKGLSSVRSLSSRLWACLRDPQR